MTTNDNLAASISLAVSQQSDGEPRNTSNIAAPNRNDGNLSVTTSLSRCGGTSGTMPSDSCWVAVRKRIGRR